MASNFDDPSLWRCRSPSGAIPFKFIEFTGSFESVAGSCSLRGLIPASRMQAYLTEMLPLPLQTGNLTYPKWTSLPGLPDMMCTGIKFKSFDDGLPIDPFGFDPDASSTTYYSVVEVTVEYGPALPIPNNNDPLTFLEISASSSAEYINTTAPKAMWQEVSRNTLNRPDAEPPVLREKPLLPDDLGAKTPVKDPTIPITIIIPKTEWTVKWNQVPYAYFKDLMIKRLRWCQGKVNDTNFELFFGAYQETVLFESYSFKQHNSWRNSTIGYPSMDVEMKFIEKHILWDGKTRGWNDVWDPKTGWKRLLIDGINPVYASRNLLEIFSANNTPAPRVPADFPSRFL